MACEGTVAAFGGIYVVDVPDAFAVVVVATDGTLVVCITTDDDVVVVEVISLGGVRVFGCLSVCQNVPTVMTRVSKTCIQIERVEVRSDTAPLVYRNRAILQVLPVLWYSNVTHRRELSGLARRSSLWRAKALLRQGYDGRCGISLLVKHQFSKLRWGVRFSHPAQVKTKSRLHIGGILFL